MTLYSYKLWLTGIFNLDKGSKEDHIIFTEEIPTTTGMKSKITNYLMIWLSN